MKQTKIATLAVLIVMNCRKKICEKGVIQWILGIMFCLTEVLNLVKLENFLRRIENTFHLLERNEECV